MAICWCCLSFLPDSRCLCQSHWTPTSSHNSVTEMARGAVIFPCHLHDQQRVLDQPSLTHSSYIRMCISFFVIIHRSTVLSILISNLINIYDARPRHALHAPSSIQFTEQGLLKSRGCLFRPGGVSGLNKHSQVGFPINHERA